MKLAGWVGSIAIVFQAAIWTSGSGAFLRAQERDQYAANNREPDPRFKADILLVVAHPDDESLVAAFLAREIYDHHKRVAVVYATRGNAGDNAVGPEQADALADVREIEGRTAVASLGIANVWFLSGQDTPGQNLLQSLGAWGHGQCLDQLVRLVRLTRPSVILTWLPDFVTGENHGDHQASGVLATEAFDQAGDPTAFPEQLAPARDGAYYPPHTGVLRPWQPEKLYFFDNRYDRLPSGWGPVYSSTEVSPSRHVSYGMIAAQELTFHQTQGGLQVEAMIKNGTLSSVQGPDSLLAPIQLTLGKSLVKSGVTDDVFAGIQPDGIEYQAPIAAPAPPARKARMEIGDPWAFYHLFWRAHGLDRLMNLVPLEISIPPGSVLKIPLVVEDPRDGGFDLKLAVQAPDGWQVNALHLVHIEAHSKRYLLVEAVAPQGKISGGQNLVVTGDADGQTIGTVTMHVELGTGTFAD